MNAAQKRSILESLDHAVESIISSWSYERGASLMDALSDLQVVKGFVEEEKAVPHKVKPVEDDEAGDEPSAGDAREAVSS